MFSIAVELLCGRYTATAFNDRDRPEWPPHPARLFSAMVAAWADSDEPDSAERDALQWLETLSDPEIACGAAHQRQVVTHFVPVNDPTALTRNVSRTFAQIMEATRAVRAADEDGDDKRSGRARAALAKAEAKAVEDVRNAAKATGKESAAVMSDVLTLLPETRGKQARTYPSVLPEQATVRFTWPDATASAAHRQALDGLLARVGRIGHSSTLVACRCADDDAAPTWVPGSGGAATRLRVPRAGLLERLERAFAVHGGEEPRTLPAGMRDYRPATTAGEQRQPPKPLLGGTWYVLSLEGVRLPAAAASLAVARAVRNSVIAHAEQPVPPLLSGHRQTDGAGTARTAPLGGPHLAVVPLLNAGHRHSDGSLSGIALILPSEVTSLDVAALERALVSWSSAGFELLLPGGIRLTVADVRKEHEESAEGWLDQAMSRRRQTASRSYWCRPAKRWLTVTPIALDRFPGDLRSAQPAERVRAEAAAKVTVARACVYAGLAADTDEVGVTIRLDAPLTGLPSSPSRGPRPGGRYPRYETGQGAARACVHAEIEFLDEVRGPVLIGAGRYLGYGLCLPSDGKETR